MVRLTEITDPKDARLAPFVGVRDRHAAGGDGFLCEGMLLVERLLDSDLEVSSVLIARGKLERLRSRLAERDVQVLIAPQEVLNATVGFNIHRGVIAAARRRPAVRAADLLATSRRIAVLEGINDHENLGAIFRSAHALGMDGMLLDATSGDPYYRRAVRVSMGATFSLPFARADHSQDLLDMIHRAGFVSIALTPDSRATSIDQFEAAELKRLALLLGSERDGLLPETLAAATFRVTVPIVAGVDSLNVGHAAAIAFHRLGSV
jgi:tRNA G18 (ribose-2'-O)-methylase SpoU